MLEQAMNLVYVRLSVCVPLPVRLHTPSITSKPWQYIRK